MAEHQPALWFAKPAAVFIKSDGAVAMRTVVVDGVDLQLNGAKAHVKVTRVQHAHAD